MDLKTFSNSQSHVRNQDFMFGWGQKPKTSLKLSFQSFQTFQCFQCFQT
jgi:hypothetical protein